MKVLILATICLAACALAQHQQHHQQPHQQPHQQRQIEFDPSSTTTWIPILAYNKEQGQDGSYKASYKTGNNIDAQETGFIKDINEQYPNGILVQHGEYQYEAPNGEIVKVKYTADEHGFRAEGDHIPTAPPIPLEIQKGLDQIYEGIKKNEELRAQRARSDPEFAKKEQDRQQANYYGHYVHSEN